MQTGRSKLSQQERMRRTQERSCFYCGAPEHQVSNCPQKIKPHSNRIKELRSTASSQEPRLPRLLAKLQADGKDFSVKLFIDSGADTEFIDINFALFLGIQMQPTTKPRSVLALDGYILNKDSLQTQKVRLCIVFFTNNSLYNRCHCETQIHAEKILI